MKKLTVKKNSECMACLQCVQACSEAFYKEFDPDYSCTVETRVIDGRKYILIPADDSVSVNGISVKIPLE